MKNQYFIVGKLAAKEIDLPIEKCTKSEGEEHYVRCYFTTLDDLEKLEDYFYRMYMRGYNSMQSSYSDDRRWDLSLNESLESEKALTKMEVEELLKGSL